MMIDRYAASKYTEAFPGDMYPASHSGSNVSVANDNQDYKVSREENVTLELKTKVHTRAEKSTYLATIRLEPSWDLLNLRANFIIYRTISACRN